MKELITRKELIKKYLEFFKSKAHKEIPNSSLIPNNDPTVLFTTAGMHPLVPYLLGQKHPLGKRLCNVQRCIRTGDIEEVGDDFHLTFFEMLGNWSLGDYFKKEAIEYSFGFLTKELNIKSENISVTCFEGDKDAPKDEESSEIWQELGIKKTNIKFLPKSDNWWGPAGNTGPCGPDTEMFINNCEIWNDVFMEYNKNKEGIYEEIPQKNVDTGMGVERVLALLNNKKNVYETELFMPLIKEIETLTKKKELTNNKSARIISDHIKASVFILGDDKAIVPSNIGQGYVLRRLIRRAIRHGKLLGIKENFTSKIAKKVLEIYPDYQELHRNNKFIIEQLDEEENKFNQTLEKGVNEFNKIIHSKKEKLLTGKEAFLLFQSYGFPIEFTEELAEEKSIEIDLEEYNEEFKRHQDLSRTLSAGTFKSGLADDSTQVKKLHTATHLLNKALKEILKDKEIKQKGSNINAERLRFDFNFPRKLTEQEIKQIENYVNDKIKLKLPIKREEIPLNEALKSGAEAEFGTKYPEMVSVYTIADKVCNISKEICTGPHANNTSDLGKFKIIKEESSASGIRRIKAILE